MRRKLYGRPALGRLVVGLLLVDWSLQLQFYSNAEGYQLKGDATEAQTALDVDGLTVAGSYRTAKRWLFEDVIFDRRQTLYCDCRFDGGKRPDAASCGYVPHNEDSVRSRRVEVEHVIPASWIGGERRCWREPICTDSSGEPYGGRDCCEASDPEYRRAANDLQNLWPSVGELNARRSNFRFGEIAAEPRAFGRCDFEVDPGRGVVEPRPEVRGDIARIGFYMEARHGVSLSRRHQDLFLEWNRLDPPNAAERERNARIRRVQGIGNSFIENYEPYFARVLPPGNTPAEAN